MAESSIHIIPVKAGSERHNIRKMEVREGGKGHYLADYVRTDLSKYNRSLVVESIAQRGEKIQDRYMSFRGKKMPSNSTPIREGVLNLNAEHGEKDLKRLCGRLHREFGIQAFQIHLHKDEGRWIDPEDSKEKTIPTTTPNKQPAKHAVWKPNLHAHVLFDWTDPSTGKTIKLNPQRMSRMQDVIAEELNMVRGKRSEKKHLNSLQFKIQEREKELTTLQEQIKALEQKKNKAAFRNTGARKEYEALQDKISLSEQRSRQWAVKGIPEYTSSLRSENKGLNRAIELQQETILQLGQDVRGQQERISGFRASDKYQLSQKLEAAIRQLETEHATAQAYQERIKKLRAEIEKNQPKG